MDSLCSPTGFPVFEEFVLLLKGFKPSSFKRCSLRVANCILDTTFTIWITDSSRVTHDTVVSQRHCVDAIEFGLIEVWCDDTFFEVIEHYILRGAAKVAPSLFM